MWFTLFFVFVVLQRLLELSIAKKNESWMRNHGAVEYGAEHYKYMVTLHIAFLTSFLFEVVLLDKQPNPFWPIILTFFILTQVLRVWAIHSLGPYWNTKVLLIAGAEIVKVGPYKFMRHPNYLIVVIEIILIPILFQAYVTAIVFTALNAWMLSVRIPLEENALADISANYDVYMNKRNRFSPSFHKDLE